MTPLPRIEAPAETLEAWCAYLNSTPAVVSFLNRRQKALDYSDYSLDQLRSMPVPDPSKCDLTPLRNAFHKLGESALLPWPRIAECPVRMALDAAAGTVLGIDSVELIDWRHRIRSEPTVSNKQPYQRDLDPFVALLMSGPTLEGLDLAHDRSPMRDVDL